MIRPIPGASLLLALLVLLTNACSKTGVNEDSLPDSPSVNKSITKYARIGLSGRITNEKEEPVSNAFVRAGNQLTQTDRNGHYNFSSIYTNANATMIEVEAQGYFRDYKSLEVLDGSKQYSSITLKQKDQYLLFGAESGGTLLLQNDGELSIPSGVIIDKVSNTTYSGNTRMDGFIIEPSSASFYSLIPTLRGLRLDRSDAALRFFSLLLLVLTGSSVQALEIAAGGHLSVRFPIADAGNAPATASLWYYDEVKGQWIEEGKAIKEGNIYKANLSRIATWSVATGEPMAKLNANVTDRSGNGLSFSRVQLFDANDGSALSGILRSDDKGYINMPVHGNYSLLMKVSDDCGSVIATKKFGTGTGTIWLGKLGSENNESTTVVLSGKMINCKNAPIHSGFVKIMLDGKLFRASISDGIFEISLPRCTKEITTATLIVVDDAGGMESQPFQQEVSSGRYDNIEISACNKQTDQYISYTINGTNYLLQAPTDSLVQAAINQENKTTILCYKEADKNKEAVSFTFAGASKPGNYPVSTLSIRQEKLQFTPSGVIAMAVTDYGAPGEFIQGSCSGKLRDGSTGKIIPFSIHFKVLRRF